MVVLFVRGFGMGGCSIPLAGAAFVGLAHDEIPHASVLTRITQQVGGSLGTAVLAMILFHANADARTTADLAAGFDTAFWWSVSFSAIAIPLCLLLPGRITPRRLDTEPAEPERVPAQPRG